MSAAANKKTALLILKLMKVDPELIRMTEIELDKLAAAECRAELAQCLAENAVNFSTSNVDTQTRRQKRRI